MPTLLSHPVNLVVKAPVSTDAKFGEGTDAGNMEGDVWYPGRDAAGRVNAVSWEQVPRRRWVTIADTKLSGLNDEVLAAVPGWTTWDLAWHKLFQSWSGFGLDLDGSRLWFLGGGHSNGHNNGLYRFDLFRMRWAVEEMPSDRTLWSSNYNPLSATRYPDSDAAAQAKFEAGTLEPINDLYYDELPGGKPTARHTYSSLMYVPETQEIVMPCRRLWRYSLSQKRWNYKRLFNDQYEAWMDSESFIATYDELTGEILFSSSGSLAKYRSTGYHLFNNDWTDWNSPWKNYGGAADARHDRLLTVFEPLTSKDNGEKQKPGRYWRYNLDSRSLVTSGEVTLAGGLTPGSFPLNSWFYDGSGLTFVPPLDEYWSCTQLRDGSMAFLSLDPKTTPWTLRPLALDGISPATRKLPKRRMNYWPALNAVTFADNGDQDFSIYRL
jgi:hypothetical protein